MTREEKLEAIYAEMANKELTFGCKLQVIESEGPIQGVIFNVVSEEYKVLWDDKKISTETKNNDFSVIGHPVMIGDVMDYLEDISRSQFDDEEDEEYFYSREEYYEDIAELSDCWVNKRLPIDNQSDECIDYVYNLIQKD